MKTFILLVALFTVFYPSHTRDNGLYSDLSPPTPYIDSSNLKPNLNPTNWLLYPLKWPQIKYVFPYEVQSPINILTGKAKLTELSPLEIHFPWTSAEEMVTIENTGYYLEVLLPHEVKQRPYLTGGPLLDSKYVFEQLHFHWGPTDQCGSENYMDGRCFSTEVHLVYYNTAYGCFEESVNHPDGVAVLAVFGNISPEHNHDFDDLINELTKVIEPESKTNGSFNKEFKFLDILFKQPTYYSFPGSLTTPSYSECVTWIVVPVPFGISPQQLHVFRKLKAKAKDGENDNKNLSDNDRPLQNFAGRPLITPSNEEKFYFTQEITFTKSTRSNSDITLK